MRYCLGIVLATLLVPSAQAICDQHTDANALIQCYTAAYIKQEGNITQLIRAARQVLPKSSYNQLRKTLGLWQPYMVAQCEFESSLYSDRVQVRQTANAMCRYRAIKQQLRYLADTLKKYSVSRKQDPQS